MSFASPLQNRRGMALLNMVFIFIFIGVMAVAGAKMYGSMVARGKITDTKGGLENQVRMIVTWAAKNGQLPTADQYLCTNGATNCVFGGTAPQDAWGNTIYYIYDKNLTNVVTGGLCGRTTTNLSDNSVPGVPFAFSLISAGIDATVQTKVNVSVVKKTADFIGIISNYQTDPTTGNSDLYRAVPLEELKNKAGCYGSSGGKLSFLNNELARVCVNTVYKISVYATGGVP
ncbi:MAG: hypothetical protein WCP33_04775, partial [Deltaproteobacteria bacterium]